MVINQGLKEHAFNRIAPCSNTFMLRNHGRQEEDKDFQKFSMRTVDDENPRVPSVRLSEPLCTTDQGQRRTVQMQYFVQNTSQTYGASGY